MNLYEGEHPRNLAEQEWTMGYRKVSLGYKARNISERAEYRAKVMSIVLTHFEWPVYKQLDLSL